MCVPLLLLAVPLSWAALFLNGCLLSSEDDPPRVGFIFPSTNSEVLEGEEIEFVVWAVDGRDETASLSFVWESSRDGEIPGQTVVDGETATMSWSGLTAGSHSIRVAVMDSDGEEGVAALPVTVLAESTVPSVEAVSPDEGDIGTAGRETEFLAAVQDPDNLPETLILKINSDLHEEAICEGQGEASGLASCLGVLRAGVHQITFTVEDPTGQQGQAELSFEVLVDGDGDGWNLVEDCDDGDAALNLDDSDLDTFSTCELDCDDTDADIHHGAPEFCDESDSDCDGILGPDPFVVHADSSESLALFRIGADKGFLVETKSLGTLAEGSFSSAVAGDFNGDGSLDVIAVRDLTGALESEPDVWWGRCDDNGFDPVGLAGSGLDLTEHLELLTAADVDNDGDLDLIGLDYFDGLGYTWLNQGQGDQWVQVGGEDSGQALPGGAFNYEWDPTAHWELEFLVNPPVDIDGDGMVDLLGCTSRISPEPDQEADCKVYLGTGDGGFYDDLGWSFELEREVVGAAVADFDGDGHLDLVGGLDDDYPAGKAWIWLGGDDFELTIQEDDVFDLLPSLGGEWTGPGQSDGPGFGSMVSYDFNSDGNPDILATVQPVYGECEGRHLFLVLGDGAGGFGLPELMAVNACQWGGGDGVWVQDFYGVPIYP